MNQGEIYREIIPVGRISTYHFGKSVITSKKNDYTLNRLRGNTKLYFGECESFPNCPFEQIKMSDDKKPTKLNDDMIYTTDVDRNSALGLVKDVMVVHCQNALGKQLCEFDISLFANKSEISTERKVPKEEGLRFANENNYYFRETTCKDISNVIDISWMFYNCKSLCSLPDISKWNISKVNDISGMFSDCSSLIFLPDISKWKTNNIKIMNNLFNGCSSLLLLPDISKWNISNVTNLDGIFSGCFSLSKIPDISKWDTSNVTDMSLLFEKCSSLVTLPDISKWNTKKVYNINYIFSNCLSLSSLPDISKWDISKLIQKEGIFIGCSSLLSIPPI